MSSYRARQERRAFRSRALAAENALRDVLSDAAGRPTSHFGFFTGKQIVLTDDQIARWRPLVYPKNNA